MMAGDIELRIRPWADGKVMLMTADENLKGQLIKMRAEEGGIVQLLTDPDMRIEAEDLEGLMCAIVDPYRVCVAYELADNRLYFVLKMTEIKET